jgi:hypothetical protein
MSVSPVSCALPFSMSGISSAFSSLRVVLRCGSSCGCHLHAVYSSSCNAAVHAAATYMPRTAHDTPVPGLLSYVGELVYTQSIWCTCHTILNEWRECCCGAVRPRGVANWARQCLLGLSDLF